MAHWATMYSALSNGLGTSASFGESYLEAAKVREEAGRAILF